MFSEVIWKLMLPKLVIPFEYWTQVDFSALIDLAVDKSSPPSVVPNAEAHLLDVSSEGEVFKKRAVK